MSRAQDVDRQGSSDGLAREAGLRVRRRPPATSGATVKAGPIAPDEPIEMWMWRCPWCVFLSPCRAVVKEHMEARPHAPVKE